MKANYTGRLSAKRVKNKCLAIVDYLGQVYAKRKEGEHLPPAQISNLRRIMRCHMKWLRIYYKDMLAEIAKNKKPTE